MNLRPVGERVLVLPNDEQRFGTAHREGTIIAVAKEEHTTALHEGEVVLFRTEHSEELILNGVTHVMIEAKDILAKIDEE